MSSPRAYDQVSLNHLQRFQQPSCNIGQHCYNFFRVALRNHHRTGAPHDAEFRTTQAKNRHGSASIIQRINTLLERGEKQVPTQCDVASHRPLPTL
jgi:hypothetical protein